MRGTVKFVAATLLTLFAFASARGTTIVLPSGEACVAVAPELNTTLAGGRISHFCSDGAALVGDATLAGDRALVTYVTYDPSAPKVVLSDYLLELDVRGATLDTGVDCLHAGHGATLALGDERANYTCDDGGALIGNFELAGNAVHATWADVVRTDAGFQLANPRQVKLSILDATSAAADTEWLLTSFPDGSAPLAGNPPTFRIADGMVAGTTGCNNYFTKAILGAEGRIDLGAAGSTMMYCEGLMEQEQFYLDALSGVDTYELHSDSTLELRGEAGVLTFTH